MSIRKTEEIKERKRLKTYICTRFCGNSFNYFGKMLYSPNCKFCCQPNYF